MLTCGGVYRTDDFGWPSAAVWLNIAGGPGLSGLTVLAPITPKNPGQKSRGERGFVRIDVVR